MAKVFAYFERSSPLAPQEGIVSRSFTTSVCQRGREGLRQLTRKSFRFSTDSRGKDEIVHGLTSKNKQVDGSLNRGKSIIETIPCVAALWELMTITSCYFLEVFTILHIHSSFSLDLFLYCITAYELLNSPTVTRMFTMLGL